MLYTLRGKVSPFSVLQQGHLEAPEGSQYVFTITHVGKANYILSAPTADEKRTWITFFQELNMASSPMLSRRPPGFHAPATFSKHKMRRSHFIGCFLCIFGGQ